jgi:DNA replication protein DnaC
MKQEILTQDALIQTLKGFRLSGMSNTLGVRLEEARSGQLSYMEFLSLLCEDEKNQREDNKRRRLYRQAKLPFAKGVEDYDFTFQPSVRKADVLELASCRFIEKGANALFLGQTGTGKTHLSVALALSALEHGKTVLFTTVWDMINSLQQSRADYSYHKKVQHYLKPDLLILDELGYRSMGEKTVEDFFEIVSKRYERGSIIITSNKAVSEWNNVFIDSTLTSAALDRLFHHCMVIEIKGDSYRFQHKGSKA